jgi:hypothetical protein
MDKKEALEIVKDDGFALETLSEEFKKDRDVVLEAIKTSGMGGLQYADKSFYKDRDLILIAVKKNGRCLNRADENLKKDREIVFAALENDGDALGDAHDTLKKDKEIVLVAVKNSGWALQHADENLKKDRDIVIEAVKQTGTAIEYAHPDLKKDKEIALMAIKVDGAALEYLDESFKNDRDFVLKAVSTNDMQSALQHAAENFKKDKEIVKAAVAANYYAFDHADKTLIEDKEFIKSLMMNEKGSNVLTSLSKSKAKLAEDKEIINLAFENSDSFGLTGGGWWQDRSLEWIKSNQDIIEKFVKKELGDLINDKPDLELKKFNKENYIHQSAVLISKTLDFFGIKKIDPKKIVEEFNNTKNDETTYINDTVFTTNLTIAKLCLGHNVLTKSVIKSFAIHFNVLSVFGEGDNYFLNHYSPDFKMALDFVEEILDDPGSSYNNKEENI